MEDLTLTPMQWPSNGQASDVATHGYQVSWSLQLHQVWYKGVFRFNGPDRLAVNILAATMME